MENLIRSVKAYAYKIMRAINNRILECKGWVMARNVQVSLKNVKKIGGVKYIVPIMFV